MHTLWRYVVSAHSYFYETKGMMVSDANVIVDTGVCCQALHKLAALYIDKL